MLYDAGPAYASGGGAGAQVIVPYLRAVGVRHLNHLMVSHEDADHAGGVRHVMEAVSVAGSSTAAPPGHALLGKGDGRRARLSQHWEWDAVHFTVLHPTAEQSRDAAVGSNARSCVLRVDNGRHSVLLTGDIGKAEERELAERLPAGTAARGCPGGAAPWQRHIIEHGMACGGEPRCGGVPAWLPQPVPASARRGLGRAMAMPASCAIARTRPARSP
ncbi:MBL fold metallo-hydrolase [Cupriavidus basilensis]